MITDHHVLDDFGVDVSFARVAQRDNYSLRQFAKEVVASTSRQRRTGGVHSGNDGAHG